MSTRITVTSTELRDIATQMTTSGGQITAELNRLMKHVEELTSSWTGQASASFNGYYTQFNQNWSKCEDALNAISAMLNGAAGSYDDAEQSVSSRFQG